MEISSLYRRVLGERFEVLPASLKLFHDQRGGGSGQGVFQVRRGEGRVRNILASLAGLPRAGLAVPVRLQVETNEGRERWIRQFGATCMATQQWLDHGRLIEAAGPWRFALEVRAEATGIYIESQRAWFYFLPLPRFLVPRIETVLRVLDDNSWHVKVRIAWPRDRLLVAYEGILQLDCPSRDPTSDQSPAG